MTATNYRHGESSTAKHPPTRAYYTWQGMISRCYYPKNIAYHRYGGRGIKVCKRWRDDFLNFLADMGRPPKEKSLDRLNNDGHYTPKNCRWATREEQGNNCINNRLITFGGVTKTLTQWSADNGLTLHALHKRLSAGWTVSAALTKPMRKDRRRK